MADVALRECVQRLSAVYIFTADIVPTEDPAYAHLGWRSGRGLEQDKSGPVFSYERVLAAAALYAMNPLITLVPSGGRTTVDETAKITIASVVAFELTLLGVPHDRIIEEPFAFNAQEQIMQCAKHARLMEWPGERVAFLAPCWQLSRITALLVHLREVEPFGINTTFISIERALGAQDPTWNERFKEFYRTPEVLEIFAKEVLGTGQLWAGHQPKYPNPFRGFNDPLA